MENFPGNELAVVATPRPAEEEMTVGTARVPSAGPLSLLTWVRLQTARLAAVILGVPQSALH